MHGIGLGYVSASERGRSDAVLNDVARRLQQSGIRLGGVIQTNTEYDPDRPCHMDLEVLSSGQSIRISQFLGQGSRGCRLDAAGLEMAVGLVEADLAQRRPDLLIINKFGKQECEGRGFRPVMGEALALGVPVLTAVSALNRSGFLAYSDGMATPLPNDTEAIVDWCKAGLLAQSR